MNGNDMSRGAGPLGENAAASARDTGGSKSLIGAVCNAPGGKTMVLCLCALCLALARPMEAFAGAPVLVWPVENFVYQRNASNTANVEFLITSQDKSNYTATAELCIGDKRFKSASFKPKNGVVEGSFKNVPSGIYALNVSVDKQLTTRMIAVGDVFIVAGQSNGFSAPFDVEMPITKTGKVFINKICVTCKLDPEDYKDQKSDWLEMFLANGFGDIQNSVFCVYAGDALVKKFNVPVAFINVCRGATSSQEWLPGGVLFSRLENAVSLIPCRAILWIQGESDMNSLSENESRNNLRDIILATRKIKDVPFIVALTSGKDTNDYEVHGVRRAQRSVIGEGMAFPGPDVDSLRNVDAYFDPAKLDIRAEGLAEHGGLWAEVLTDFLLRQGDARAPGLK